MSACTFIKKFSVVLPTNDLLTAVTGSECAGNVFKLFPVFTSQIRTLSSNYKKHRSFCTKNVKRFF